VLTDFFDVDGLAGGCCDATGWPGRLDKVQVRYGNAEPLDSKYPPAEPGALLCEPLEAA
jgi:hypothetical protein